MLKRTAIVLALLHSPAAPAADLILGGWSDHRTEGLNERHGTFGILFDDGVMLGTFINSYDDQSAVVAYRYVMASKSYKFMRVELAAVAGIVTGYEEAFEGFGMPSASFSLGPLSLDVGYTTEVITYNLRLGAQL